MHDIQLAIHNVQGTLATLEERKRAIYARRLVAANPQTLDELGADFGVTRERIRQIESKLVKDLKKGGIDEIVQFANLPKLDRFVIHQSQLGNAETSKFFGSYPGSALELLRAAGVVETWDGPWVSVGFKASFRKTRGPYYEYFASQLSQKGLTREDAVSELEALGLKAEFVEDFLAALGLHIPFNRVRPINIDAITFVEDLLEQAGRPMKWHEEIAPLIAGRWNSRGILGRVQELKDRFTRTDVASYAVASLGLPAYEGITREIEKLVEKHGPVNINLVIELLTARFDISAESVRAYAKQGQLETVEGIVKINPNAKRAGVPNIRDLTADQLKNIQFFDEHSTFTTVANEDRLRGSGMPVSRGVAAVVGLAEEHPLQFEVSGLDNCVLNFSWRKGTQPQLGSVRPILEQLGAVEGDFLVLSFHGEVGNPVRVEAELKKTITD
jgi:Sigma-70, region 4